ncbi:hypothetical protein [Frankia sp. AgB32]|uniref:hypothetical protein n=1 Tax=Frankia sp. AgB32 TaxID=631119 RepID=UPI00200D29DE|nr:hypothetical protein [Frankia sp. AgB32]MCK9897751.1 hypothetical protein [Frankia sp. AgB32]
MDPALRIPPSRRRLLAGLGGLALTGAAGALCTGCTTTTHLAEPDLGLSPTDVAAARSAVARSTALAASYRAAAARHPSLRLLFDALQTHHEVAVATLDAQVPAAAGAPATPGGPQDRPAPPGTTPAVGQTAVSGAGSGAPAATVGVDESPSARVATLTALHTTEGTAAATARTDSLRVSGTLAPLLASLHAAGAAQVELLGGYLAQAGGAASGGVGG